MTEGKLKRLIKTLGPGILFASTAIGVSHLVQSTRAGAEYGFALVPFILAANIFKYPFFEFGSRYANATGTSIIDGYRKMGKWMLWLYVGITLVSMFFVSAAVGAVTAGFFQNLFGIASWGIWTSVLVFAGCILILIIGKYKVLDSMIKVIGAVLLLSTLIAFCLALGKGSAIDTSNFQAPEIFTDSSMIFIIALMGWMPTAVDLSAWNSLWTVERIKQTGYKPTLKETLTDFNFGYIVSALLAICFVTLGAYVMYGSGSQLSDNKGEFAQQVVDMFTSYMGDWSFVIIAAAAFSIMFGTCIAVFDGYARSFERVTILSRKNQDQSSIPWMYRFSLVIVGVGSFAVVYFLGSKLKLLVDIATIISFLIAPVIAIVNFRLVTGNQVSDEYKPKIGMRILSWLGIVFLTGFALYYAVSRIAALV